ncbi:hypothetical protein [Evansella tamaricis]|uniref:Tetratricopeptide repeat protein n=1 Tax=Evansella tamaricis TaxID=2069301 RepID=A0ABS6JNE2_9BACI|nr:hypothetical protein [Evansella tamaricis]MBU9713930.1 hypothetical protein [Evansella tamaricis]
METESSFAPYFTDIDRIIDEGYCFFDKDDYQKACDIWIDAWVKTLEWVDLKDLKDIQEVDKLIDIKEVGQHLLVNWIQDLEMALECAGKRDSRYYQMRFDVSEQFRHHFSESEPLILFNFSIVSAESLYHLDQITKAERLFEQIIEKSNNPWGYIRWGDLYHPANNFRESNKKKAHALYLKGMELAIDSYDQKVLEERIKSLLL